MFQRRSRQSAHHCEILILGTVLLVLCLGGCTSGGSGRPAVAYQPPRQELQYRLSDADCGSKGSGPRQSEPLAILLPEDVLAVNAPVPVNASERLVFRHLYETLTRVDCRGRVRGELASSWNAYDGGKTWVFNLRQEARFWDGRPVTAAAVVASWATSSIRHGRTYFGPSVFAWFPTGSDNLEASGTRQIIIRLAEPMDDLPLVLASAELSVRTSGSVAGGWPVGSGPCIPVAELSGGETRLVLEANPDHRRPPIWPRLTVSVLASGTSLLVLPDEIDLTLVRESDTLTALSSDRSVEVVDLPWDRMHLLICPPANLGATADDRLRWTTGWSPRQLAGEHSPAPASGAPGWSFLWPRHRTCPLLLTRVLDLDWPDFDWPEVTTSRPEDLVLFPAGDEQAGALAEELAWNAGRPLRPGPELVGRGALTPPYRPGEGFAPQAVGVPAVDFFGALQSGQAGAFVLPVWRSDPSACRQLAGILGLASWLQDAALDGAGSDRALPPGARAADPVAYADVAQAESTGLRLERSRILLPLTLSRAGLVVRAGLSGIQVDHDGAVDLTGAGFP